MNSDMQMVIPKRGKRIIHVETELGIWNIYIGLTDVHGRRVETCEVVRNQYSCEPRVKLTGKRQRLIELKS